MTIVTVNSYNEASDIQVVGVVATPATNADIYLPAGLQQNDVVYIVGTSDDPKTPNSHNTAANGFITIFSDMLGNPCSLVLRKVMGATPEANCNIGATGCTFAFIAVALRNANRFAPEGALFITSGTTGMPTPPSCNVQIGKSMILAIGYLDDDNVYTTLSLTKPDGYENVTRQYSSDATVSNVMMGHKREPFGGAIQPGPFKDDGVATDAWYAITLGVAPAPYIAPAAPNLGYGFSKQAKDFFDRLATAPTLARMFQYDSFIRRLISCNEWDMWDALYLFAAADQATALTSLVSSAYNCTAVSSPGFTADKGFLGNGASAYLDTNFNPITAVSPKFTQSSAMVFGWSDTDVADTGGILGNGSTDIYGWSRTAGGQAVGKINGGAGFAQAVTDGRGLLGGVRDPGFGSTITIAVRQNVVTPLGGTTSAAPHSSNIVFLRSNTSQFSSSRLVAGGIGSVPTSGSADNIFAGLHIWAQEVTGLVKQLP